MPQPSSRVRTTGNGSPAYRDQATKSAMKVRAWVREPNRSGKTGEYLHVLNHDSEYGLSLLTCGREWDRVTDRSSNNVATLLEVIAVPRSACTTVGAPCTPKICFIISVASTPASVWCTWAPTMYRE